MSWESFSCKNTAPEQSDAAPRFRCPASPASSLTGIGGVGKTRLALRVAGEIRRAFPDGVYFVDLASLRDPDLLTQTLIDALGIREQPSMDAVAVLDEFLRERRLLLILDNCDHLVEATAELVDHVLRTAPEVRVLATSREVLRIAGEHIYPVPPLLAPDPNDLLEPGAASRYPSVALFVDRSAAVVPGFTITPENEAAVVRPCHRLEGIPLAIELASARLRALIVDELDDRFQLLRDGSRNLPERHRTLQALVDWSYDLCTPIEQVLWARSPVFAGGFTAEAVEAICTDDAVAAVGGSRHDRVSGRQVHPDPGGTRSAGTLPTARDPVLVLATWDTSRAIALPDTGKTTAGAITGGPEE
ncbi:AAA family ATPase [Streptomyces sp. CB02959]|uniref:ATP-binding protein n=1 Tax=Streptomyces sp. CB02959 TaxID=2020330 RepID=UPI002152AB9C|nr:AAA family ATPase [Streptomyces sp. CB02959]